MRPPLPESSGVVVLEAFEVEIRTLHAILGSERDPDGRAFAPLADAYRRAGEPRKAFGLLTDGLARLPDFVSGHVVAARLYAEQGLFEEGEIAARRALDLDPENVSALAALVRLMDGAGRAQEARDAYETLQSLEPEVIDEEGLMPPHAPPADEEAEAGAEGDVLDVAALAPDPVEAEEDVLEVASLAPDPVEAEEDVLDVASLAPDSVEAEEDVLDVAALAPDPVEAEEDVLDVATLAPDPVEAEEGVLDVAALAPDPTAEIPTVAASPPREVSNPSGSSREGGAPRIYTRTLGELYAKQGFLDRAVEVFRQLRSERPDDEDLAARLAQLEARMEGDGDRDAEEAGPPPRPEAGEAEADVSRREAAKADEARARDEELENLARDLAEHRERHAEIDTPFAWTGEVEDSAESPEDVGPSIGSYFDDLLDWRPGGDRS